MARYEKPAILAPIYIDDEAPLGLVRTFGDASIGSFWICMHDGAKWAIALSSADSKLLFLTWQLVGSAQHWTGLTLGGVELLVDVDECVPGSEKFAGVGHVFIQDGDCFLKVRTESYLQTMNIKIGKSAIAMSAGLSVSFPKWHLIKVDDCVEKTILFSTSPKVLA